MRLSLGKDKSLGKAWAVCLFRVWRLQILRSFWTSAAAPAPPRNLGQSFFQGSYDAPPGTHPQEVMHGVLSRVATAWQQPEWTIVSAVPFKEVEGILKRYKEDTMLLSNILKEVLLRMCICQDE